MVELAERFIPFRGHRTWTGVAGSLAESRGLPLLCLHGGPGVPHDLLAPITQLSEQGRAVIVYDQLGCGRSDHPHDPSLWSVELFVEEVTAVRQALGLERIHLLGQSWGGMLALETVLGGASGLETPGAGRLAGEHPPVDQRGQPPALPAAPGRAGGAQPA